MAKYLITKDPKFGIVTGQELVNPVDIKEWIHGKPRQRVEIPKHTECPECHRLDPTAGHKCPPVSTECV